MDQLALSFELKAGRAFSPTAPIDERSLFAGRVPQVHTLLRAVSQKGQHAILFGERGVGKTSLANVLSSFLGEAGSDKLLAPRINCDALDTFESVWRKVLDEIHLNRSAQPPGFTSQATSRSFSSATLLSDPVSPESVRRALSTISRIAVPILIIDEFDRLPSDVKRQIADTIKTLSDHAVDVTVILVGVADSVMQLIEEHESVGRALVQVRMPRMSPEEIKQIINTGLQELDLRIETVALEQIVTLVQGLPHYAHLLGLHAAEIAHGKMAETITAEIVDQATAAAISGAQQSIKTAWHTAITSPRKDNLFAEVLIACALAKVDDLGYFAAQDVREPLRKILGRTVEIANFAQHLSEFSDARRGPVLERTGTSRKYRFRFKDPLLQPYVVMQGFATNRIKRAA